MRVNVFTGTIDYNLAKSDVLIAIDVLRSSTTILTALANGAKKIIPVSSVEEALRIGREIKAVIGGEVESIKPSYFHLGNSPLDYTRDRVDGKTIVLYTSSGAKLLRFLALFSKEVLIGALINLSTLIDYLIKRNFKEVSIITAGKMGQPALEDSYCAGLIAKRLPWDKCNKNAEVAIRISEMSTEVVKSARHTLELIKLGLEEDVDYSLSLDRVRVVAGLESPTGYIQLL
ncbi:MAG: 2-phosphosulfolactate phosphatase [Thermoproteota archaeon]